MLSVEELRQLLARPQLTDEQVTEIRDILYAFAGIFIDGYLRERRGTHTPPKR